MSGTIETMLLNRWFDNPEGRVRAYRQSGAHGVVYAIGPRDGRVVKIGWTLDLDERHATIQIYWPERVIVHGFFPGPRSLEAAMHETFQDYQLRGEWFLNEERQITKHFRTMLSEFVEGRFNLDLVGH